MQKSTLIRTEVFTANTKTIVTNAYTIEAQNQQYYQNTPSSYDIQKNIFSWQASFRKKPVISKKKVFSFSLFSIIKPRTRADMNNEYTY